MAKTPSAPKDQKGLYVVKDTDRQHLHTDAPVSKEEAEALVKKLGEKYPNREFVIAEVK